MTQKEEKVIRPGYIKSKTKQKFVLRWTQNHVY